MLALGWAAFQPTALAQAQARDQEPSPSFRQKLEQFDEPLRVGIALSGGGAKGFFHVGVLNVLEEQNVEIAYVSGTSMGAIVGGLYAIGYSSAQLDSISRNLQWQRLFSEQTSRRHLNTQEKRYSDKFLLNFPITSSGIDLPQGIISGQEVYMKLSRLTRDVHLERDFRKFQRPFSAIATNLETGEPVVLDHGYLPDVIRASISIPTIFSPFSINDTVMIDGGLSRNLPVDDVRDLGANFVIASNVGEPLKEAKELESMIDVLNQTVFFRTNLINDQQKRRSDLVIEPHLDTLKNYSISDFGKAEELIELGERHARRQLANIGLLVRKQQAQQSEAKSRSYTTGGNYLIRSLEIEGETNLSKEFIRTELQLEPIGSYSSNDIEEAIQRLYNTNYFNSITYRVSDTGSGQKLIVRVIEKNINILRAGFRYDNERQASILLHSTFQNLLMLPSITRLDLRLGEEVVGAINHTITPGRRPRFGVGGRFLYYRDNIDWYEANNRTAGFVTHDYQLQFHLGYLLNDRFELMGGLRQDFVYFSNVINEQNLPFNDSDFYTLFGRFWYDSLRRAHFPSSGQQLIMEYNIGEPFTQTSDKFTRQLFYYNGNMPLSDIFTVQTGLILGRTTGDEVPFSHWIRVNDLYPIIRTFHFTGLPEDRDIARNIYLFQVGLQAEFSFNKFLTLSSNFGSRPEGWDRLNPQDPQFYGIGAGIGAITLLGPVSLNISRSNANNFFIRLNAGYRF